MKRKVANTWRKIFVVLFILSFTMTGYFEQGETRLEYAILHFFMAIILVCLGGFVVLLFIYEDGVEED